MNSSGHIGIVGAGLVGTSWSLVFAAAGLRVKIYDSSASAREGVVVQLTHWLYKMQAAGLLSEPVSTIVERCEVVDSIAVAVDGAVYVQECVREDLQIKTRVSAEIAVHLDVDAFVGSSTSGFPSSSFTREIDRRDRFLVVHPVNPPHLVPVVEIVPSPWTDPAVADAARALMTKVGQMPVSLTHEIDGFILNRLQGALLDEAWRLYGAGYASLADIDATISHGLGIRWSFMGPFETIDLNAQGGLADYAAHLAPMYRRIAKTRPQIEPWNAADMAKAHADRRSLLPSRDLPERRNWRDDMLLRVVSHQQHRADT